MIKNVPNRQYNNNSILLCEIKHLVAFSTWKRTLSTEQILNTYTQWTLITYLLLRNNKLSLHIWEALNCLLSVMFECQVSLLSVACIFKPAYLLIAFQQQVTNITIHMRKNDGLENYLEKNHIWEFLSHSRECRSRTLFLRGSRMIREGSRM